MAGVSKIKRLPKSIRAKINDLLDEGASLDEIKLTLDDLGADISRSSLGRYMVKATKCK